MAHYPAMLARIDGPLGELQSLHRTYLASGQRVALPAARKVLAPVQGGAAVRLFACGDTLAVALSIESALAVHPLWNVPVWSGLCAGNLVQMQLPAQVRQVLVFAEDTHGQFCGLASAYALAHRLRADHDVQVLVPQTGGAHWPETWRRVMQRMRAGH